MIIMEQSLISWLMEGCKDFWDDEHGTYRYCNDMGCELPDRLISLLGSYADSGFDYDITCEQVFESCSLDIYSISIAAVTYEEGKKPEVETILFTAKCY